MTEVVEHEMAIKILHTADWHLGRRFRSFTEEQEVRLTRARLEAVSRILDLAHSRNVDAVLCAGDLFDSPVPDEEWWQGVLNEFARRDWTRPVFLLPGNHDPLTPRSLYDPSHEFRRSLPDYVHVVDKDGFSYELGPLAVIVGNPCRSAAGQTDLASSLPAREEGDERIRIGLVHGQTFDIEGHQTNFPIARGIAEERGFDYLAIGDTHAFREVEPGAPVPTVYPSAPEATNFGEQDTGYVALVFFPRDRARRAHVEKVQVGVWRWREETCRSLAQLRALRADDSLRKTVLRLHVDMTVPLEEYDEARRLLTELRGSLSASPRVGVLMADESQLRLAMDDAVALGDDVPEVMAGVVERLRARAALEPEKAERALHQLYRIVRGQM
jgi:DNA repair exonuclease SbcCD nuclease subunit